VVPSNHDIPDRIIQPAARLEVWVGKCTPRRQLCQSGRQWPVPGTSDPSGTSRFGAKVTKMCYRDVRLGMTAGTHVKLEASSPSDT
jgi:hypothetical protein